MKGLIYFGLIFLVSEKWWVQIVWLKYFLKSQQAYITAHPSSSSESIEYVDKNIDTGEFREKSFYYVLSKFLLNDTLRIINNLNFLFVFKHSEFKWST